MSCILLTMKLNGTTYDINYLIDLINTGKYFHYNGGEEKINNACIYDEKHDCVTLEYDSYAECWKVEDKIKPLMISFYNRKYVKYTSKRNRSKWHPIKIYRDDYMKLRDIYGDTGFGKIINDLCLYADDELCEIEIDNNDAISVTIYDEDYNILRKKYPKTPMAKIIHHLTKKVN